MKTLDVRQGTIVTALAAPLLPGEVRAVPGTATYQGYRLLRLEDGDAGHALWVRHRGRFWRLLDEYREEWAVAELDDGTTELARPGSALCPLPTVGPFGGQLP